MMWHKKGRPTYCVANGQMFTGQHAHRQKSTQKKPEIQDPILAKAHMLKFLHGEKPTYENPTWRRSLM